MIRPRPLRLGRQPRRHRRRLAAAFVLAALIAGGVVFRPAPALPPYHAARYVRDSEGNELRVLLGEHDSWCVPVPLEQMGDWSAAAIISAEDKRFRRHPGVDPKAILRALASDIRHRRIVSGASTLTTQLVKLTHPRPRTPVTKVLEAVGAVRLERRYTKEALLEQYLNRTPFGSNIYGIEAAARYYFEKPAAGLTLAEASLLLGLPQSPSRMRPDRHLPRAMIRRTYVLGRMQTLGEISAGQRHAAEAQPIVPRTRRPAFRAPHFVECALRETAGIGAASADLITTLDPLSQAVAEQELARHMATHPQLPGGAIVILDVASSQVRALVGSPDYDDTARAGRINGAVRRRSPGSSLKPFIYAQAFDRGICLPASVLRDAPIVFADYRPGNFDETYRGDVRADDALAESLNIPALLLARELGLTSVFDLLRSLDLTAPQDTPEHCGLAAVLGAVNVRLLDLANAYACLARGGQYRPASFLATSSQAPLAGPCSPSPPSPHTPTPPRALISPAAAFLVTEALGSHQQNMRFRGHTADVNTPRVAWKTGTSTGGRDAWTVVFTPDTIIAVWLGDIRSDTPGGLIGVRDALPLANAIVMRLPALRDDGWFEPPPELERRRLCMVSGCPATPHCPSTRAEWFIPGVSSPRRCTRHGTPLLAASRPQTATPPDATAHTAAHAPLSIRSPVDGSRFVLLPSLGDAQTIALRAADPSDSLGTCYWFLNGTPIGHSTPGTPLRWSLRPGAHTLACRTATGASARSRITVTLAPQT